MIIEQQKQVVIKQKSEMHTEARYFALKFDLNSTNKEIKYSKEFVKNFLFLKINKRRVLIRSRGLEKNRKPTKRERTLIRHLRVNNFNQTQLSAKSNH